MKNWTNQQIMLSITTAGLLIYTFLFIRAGGFLLAPLVFLLCFFDLACILLLISSLNPKKVITQASPVYSKSESLMLKTVKYLSMGGGVIVFLFCAFIIGSIIVAPSKMSIVQVVNQKPVASAGLNKEVHLGSLTYLDGSASYDPDKKPLPLTYNWKQISGPDVLLFDSSTSKPKFTPSTKGTYLFSLKVNDGQSYSNISTTSVNAL